MMRRSRPYTDGTRSVPGEIERPVERVIIVGAGIAGLTVANALTHVGVETVVLEARRRIGGRVHTVDLEGLAVDLGCSWIHEPLGNPLTAWADQVGVGRQPGNALLDAVLWDPIDGRLDVTQSTVLLQSAGDGFPASRGRLLAVLGDEVSVADAIDRFVAERLDGDLGGQDAPRLRHLLRMFAEQDSGGRAEDVILRNHPTNGLDYEGDYLGDMPVGGYRRLIAPLAAGVDVRLGQEVVEIASDSDRVRVATAAGTVHNATHAVVTAPLGVLKAGAIRFAPPLPDRRQSAIDRLGFGSFEKLAVRFERPFWTEAGVPNLLPVPHDGKPALPAMVGLDGVFGEPVVVALAFGSYVGILAEGTDSEALGRVVDVLRRATGVPVPEPSVAVRTRWGADSFSRGAYAFVRRGSEPSDLDELGRPIGGRVLFAGEATGHARVGFADGALSTGIREAKRLLGTPEVELGPLQDVATA